MNWTAHTSFAAIGIGTILAIHETMVDPKNPRRMVAGDVGGIEFPNNARKPFMILDATSARVVIDFEGDKFVLQPTKADGGMRLPALKPTYWEVVERG